MPATNTTVAAGKIAAHGITLSAATVDTVTFADDCEQIEVVNHDGAAQLWFTVDGSNPAANGSGSYLVLAAAGASLRVPVPTSGGTVVKLISTGTPKYSVTRTL